MTALVQMLVLVCNFFIMGQYTKVKKVVIKKPYIEKRLKIAKSLLGDTYGWYKYDDDKLRKYLGYFKKYSIIYGIDEDIILAVAYVETKIRNTQSRSSYKDTGVLQVVPRFSHIRKFVDREYGKPENSYGEFLKSNEEAAIHAGVWELRHFKRAYKRYLKYRCKFTWKYNRVLKVNGKDFRYIPFYNWGNTCYVNKKMRPRFYPFAVMRAYRKIQKLKNN